MLLKEEILGIRCDLIECQHDASHDEVCISVNGNKIILSKNNIGFLEPLEKFAVLGESACYIKTSGIINLIGPTISREFLLKINSRGNLHELLVPESEILFLR